jgi:response regulator RpfG family c-di-GMP phosphodiesterase
MWKKIAKYVVETSWFKAYLENQVKELVECNFRLQAVKLQQGDLVVMPENTPEEVVARLVEIIRDTPASGVILADHISVIRVF